MSTQWLPNVNRILSAARTYKRACGKVRTTYRKAHEAGNNVINNINHPMGLALSRAQMERDKAAARLLWFVQSGEKSLAKMKP